MNIKDLKEEIKKQEETNIKLYKSIPLPTHEDPRNLKAEPILKAWREGKDKLLSLLEELKELELAEIKNTNKPIEHKTFVNGFGEATRREITTLTYRRQQKRLDKEILSFISGLR